jgi:flagellin-like hook-associated protein FlgL
MAVNIKLSSAIRSNLLALQDTANLVARTQGRLSTGLKVASAIDDAVAFFQAKALSDRAGDLTSRKDGIDQGISSLTVALKATESVESVFSQMKGILLSAKSATSTERVDLQIQFDELAKQSNLLVNDASYQGLNLLNSTATQLKVSFSEKSASVLSVDGSNVQLSGFTAAFGITVLSAAGLGGNLIDALNTTFTSFDLSNQVSTFDAIVERIDSAITSVRSKAKSLGSNVSLLKTRLDFTSQYVNTLSGGSDKLTLADLNEEGANLVALQTRQQLATQALAFAGQSEQAVLQLFQ